MFTSLLDIWQHLYRDGLTISFSLDVVESGAEGIRYRVSNREQDLTICPPSKKSSAARAEEA